MVTIVATMRYQDALRGNIKAELGRSNRKAKEAAAAIGLAPGVFSSRLNGRTEWRVGELIQLAIALRIPFDRLVEGVDEDQRESGEVSA